MRKIGTGGAGDDEEADLVGGPHTKERLSGNHERAKVKTRFRRGRHPRTVDGDDLTQRLDEVLNRQRREGFNTTEKNGALADRHPGKFIVNSRFEPRGGALHASGVGLRPKAPDGAVLVTVRLHTLENLLRVVQHRSRGVQLQRTVRTHCCVVPTAIAGPGDFHHVVGEVNAESGVGQNRLALSVSHRRGGGGHIEAE